MSKDIQNKTVIITGGASGIGYEIADSFLKKKPKVIIILDINVKQGAEAIRSLKSKHGSGNVVFYKCDVTTDLEALYKTITETFRTVDVLINNAGILNDQSVRKTIDINVTALIEWSLKFWEHTRKDKSGGGGTIINIASIYGYRTDPYFPVYQASKAAVMAFTKSLGHNYNFSRFGIRVVAVCPGFTKTQLFVDLNTWTSGIMDDFQKFEEQQTWQTSDAVGEAAVDVFEMAESGTAWLIEGAKPITQVL